MLEMVLSVFAVSALRQAGSATPEPSHLLAVATECTKSIADNGVRSTALERIAVAKTVLGDARGAADTLREIPECYDRVIACTRVARIQARRGDLDDAVSTCVEAQKQIAALDGDFRIHNARAHLASAWARAGRYQEATAEAQKVRGYDHAMAWTGIAAAYARIGRLEEALSTVQRVDVEYRDDHVLEVAHDLLAAGQGTEALKVTLRAKDGPNRDLALGEIGIAQCNKADFAAAAKTLALIRNPEDRAMALIQGALRRADVGDHSGACTLLDDAAKCADGIPDKRPRERTRALALLTVGWTAAGRSSDAALRARECVDFAASNSDGLPLDAALALAVTGRTKEAWNLLENSRTKAGDWDFQFIAFAQADAGLFEAAIETAERCDALLSRAGLYAKVAAAPRYGGDRSKMWTKAASSWGQVAQPIPRRGEIDTSMRDYVKCALRIADALGGIGQFARAEAVVERLSVSIGEGVALAAVEGLAIHVQRTGLKSATKWALGLRSPLWRAFALAAICEAEHGRLVSGTK